MLKSTLMGIAFGGALTLATGAMADGGPSRSLKDTYVAPFSWTGFYAGVNAGYGWGNSDLRSASSCNLPAGTGYLCDAGTGAAGLQRAIDASNTGSGSLEPRGFTGGIQAGANWQAGTIVYGAELDFNAFNLNASRSATAPYTTGAPFRHTVSSTVDTDWLFTARARLGLALSNTLLYVTGGLAMTDLQLSTSFRDNQGAGSVMDTSNSRLRTGWTVGGGAEFALNRNWTLKAEYLYVDFGAVTTAGTIRNASFPGFTSPYSSSADLTAHIARAGINYKF